MVSPQGKYLRPTVSVDQDRGTPRITGHELFDGVACTVIQLKQERGVTQTYWIEDERQLVRKWTVDEGETHNEVVYPVVRLGVAVKADLFTYDPKAVNAKDRNMRSSTAPLRSVGQAPSAFSQISNPAAQPSGAAFAALQRGTLEVWVPSIVYGERQEYQWQTLQSEFRR